ncbi:MAG: SDR family oxidoreductase [Alphaproteobacteria bacterium]|nr:SDR family oxidoreductase [Alphaproteobacteria bacterium]
MPTVFITGSNRGLGLEFARQYAHAGWRVIATCRDPGCSAKLSGLPGVEIHALDVTDYGWIKVLADKLKDKPIDLMLCNAAQFGGDQEFGAVDVDDFAETLNVNVIAPMMLAQAFRPHVAASQGRVMAFLSSRMGSIADNASGGFYIYRASKAALNALVKSLSVDLESSGIVSLALHPGWVKTDMGGEAAPLSPGESISGLRKVLGQVTSQHSGKFLSYNGEEIPW